MSAPGVTVTQTGLLNIRRASDQAVFGVDYVGLQFERMMHVAARGDPRKEGFESTPAGITPPQIEADAAITLNVTGSITVATGDKIYVTYTFSSSRYTPEDQGSDPGPVTTATSAVDGSTGRVEVSFSGDWAEPVDNSIGADDYVDQVKIWRTVVDPAEITEDTDQAAIRGTFYLAETVSLDSFRTFSQWTASTEYEVGDKISAEDTPLPDITTMYECINRVDSTQAQYAGTLAQQVTAGYWKQIGQSPVFLNDSDETLVSNGIILSARRGVPPDMWSLTMSEGRLIGTGQEDYRLRVNVTNGSATVTTGTLAKIDSLKNEFDRVPTGIAKRNAEVEGDGRPYAVKAWLSSTSFTLNETYAGTTASNVYMILKGIPGAIYGSEVQGQEGGLIGEPLPDAWDNQNIVLYHPTSGHGNEFVAAGRNGYWVGTRHSIGWASGWGIQPEEIEKVEIRSLGNRGIAVMDGGALAVMCSDGIRLYTGASPGEEITSSVRNFWEPRPATEFNWAMPHIDRSFLVWHSRLKWLWAFGPLASRLNGIVQDNVSTALVRDEFGAWQMFRFFVDVDGTLCQPDITAGCMRDVNGQAELFVAGRIRYDLTGDDTLNGIAIGRFWQTQSGYFDDVPADLGGTIVDHRIPYSRLMTPLYSEDGADITVNDIVIYTTPRTTNGKFGVTLQVQPDASPEAVEAIQLYSNLSRFRHPFSPRANRGRRAQVGVFGFVGGPGDEMRFEECIAVHRLVGKGERS